MVSLLIPAIAQAIQHCSTSEEVYSVLVGRRCLTRRARRDRPRVIALIQKTRHAFPARPELGRELSRETIDVLNDAGYLNLWGRTWGMRMRRRT
jgi:hypothetical protein